MGFPEPSDDPRDLLTALVAIDGRIAQFEAWVESRGYKSPANLVPLARELDGLDLEDTIRRLREAWDVLVLLPAADLGSPGFRPQGPVERFGESARG
jgi:hypothetical protein